MIFSSANFSSEQHAWMLKTYRHLCSVGRMPLDPAVDGCSDVISASANSLLSTASTSIASSDGIECYLECRRQCAYNFPVRKQKNARSLLIFLIFCFHLRLSRSFAPSTYLKRSC